MINPSFFRDISPDHSQVVFLNFSISELATHFRHGFRIQGKEQNAGCASIQAVNRPDPLSQLISKHWQTALLTGRQFSGMNMNSRRLVNGYKMIIFIKYFKCFQVTPLR